MSQDLDETIEHLVETCECDACERYRRADVAAARNILLDAIGTPREELARAYLRVVVEKAKRRSP